MFNSNLKNKLEELSTTNTLAKVISKDISKHLKNKETDLIKSISNIFSGLIITSSSKNALNKLFLELEKVFTKLK